ncbi:MAG: universal stress protein [Chloroflexia bacterium]
MVESLPRLRTILIPLLNLSVAPDMLSLAAGLIAGSESFLSHRARIVVLAVVTVAPGQAPGEGSNMARAYRAMLGYLPQAVAAPGPETAPALQVPVIPLIKVAPSLGEGIRDAVSSESADLLLVYWKGYASHPESNSFGKQTDSLLRDPPCNMVLVRLGERGLGFSNISRILMPLRGGPSAELALDTGRQLAGRLDIGVTMLHSVRPGQARSHGDAPYLALQRHLEEEVGTYAQPVEQIISRAADTPTLVAEQIAPGDMLLIGLRDPVPDQRLTRGPVLERALADPERTVLMARAVRRLNMAAYMARLDDGTARGMRAEQWFVENSYHSDEFADAERLRAVRRERQAHLSIVLPTHNDGTRIASMLTGLQRGLRMRTDEAEVDEILVVDAASQDDTLALAAKFGVPVMRMDRRPGYTRGGTPGPAAMLREALNLATGDILIWLDPKGGRLPPGEVPALVGPLLHSPNLLLVKPFWASPPPTAEDEGAIEAGARFSRLKPADLLSMSVRDLAQVPPHSWWRAFYPQIGGLLNPTGHIFAARAGLLRELLPTLEHYEALVQAGSERSAAVSQSTAFYSGLLLETVARQGSRVIAQVEMPRRVRGKGQGVAGPDLRQLRHLAELLAYFALRPDAGEHQSIIEELQVRLLQVSA